MAYAAELGLPVGPGEAVRWVESGSGARLAICGGVVVKVHHERTDESALSDRLEAASAPALSELVVQPLTPEPGRSPAGLLVTAWPLVDTLTPDDPVMPWREAGVLLARLHQAPLPPLLPPQGGPDRLARAVDRTRAAGRPAVLRDVGERLLAGLGKPAGRHPGRPVTVVHGDWHLGQLARTPTGWRLIDLDDLGVGDPAWDLARPAGFWAAGLLDDESWEVLLTAYRDAGGPAVPVTGDPWPALDLPARCAVFVAAVRELRLEDRGHASDTAATLLAACRRM